MPGSGVVWQAGSGKVGCPWLWFISFSKPERRRWAELSGGRGWFRKVPVCVPQPAPRPGDGAALPAGSKESLFSCALTASEEAMAVLEEVVLYAFQQCVYYVSKVPRHVPGA